MPKPTTKHTQRAQGMVEFALVMPILLLVILGIIAFGHLFFAYSSVVSASREAARYGAVVGENAAGEMRFRDCAGIRAAAERIGNFAGVTAVEPPSRAYDGQDNGVYIGYDRGSSAAAPFARCPQTGPGPATVDLGDRILVRVTIQYESIVPLVNFPSFPLTATTARTIIKSLPVADAPTAEPGCLLTDYTLDFQLAPPSASLPSPAVVGQHVIPIANITAMDGSSPTGTVVISDDLGESCSFNAPTNAGLSPNPCDFVYDSVGVRTFLVAYQPSFAGICYLPTVGTGQIEVIPADTITEITLIQPEPSRIRERITINFRVRAATPGGGVPDRARVTVSDRLGNTCDDQVTSDGSGVYAVGSCTVTLNAAGLYSFFASYPGSANYNPSTSTDLPHIVINPATPTLLPSPTAPTPPLPVEVCPYINPDVLQFPAGRDEFTMDITNPNTYNFQVSRVSVLWPDSMPTAQLQQVEFASRDTLWQARNRHSYLSPDPVNPVSITPELAGWRGGTIGMGQTKQMIFSFSSGLLSGQYLVEVMFTNSTGQTCTTPLLTYYR